jgi:hypothetical protein
VETLASCRLICSTRESSREGQRERDAMTERQRDRELWICRNCICPCMTQDFSRPTLQQPTFVALLLSFSLLSPRTRQVAPRIVHPLEFLLHNYLEQHGLADEARIRERSDKNTDLDLAMHVSSYTQYCFRFFCAAPLDFQLKNPRKILTCLRLVHDDLLLLLLYLKD